MCIPYLFVHGSPMDAAKLSRARYSQETEQKKRVELAHGNVLAQRRGERLNIALAVGLACFHLMFIIECTIAG